MHTKKYKFNSKLFRPHIKQSDWEADVKKQVISQMEPIYPLRVNSLVYVVAVPPKPSQFRASKVVEDTGYIFEAYRKEVQANLTINRLGKVRPNRLINFTNYDHIWDRRKNLTGVHLNVAIEINYPFVYKEI